MTQPSRLLSQEAYEATFSPPMRDVTGSAEEIVDLWGYADPVIEDLYHNCSAWHWRVSHIHESQDGTFQHINVPVPKDDTYLSIIVHKPDRKIIGHYILDLGALHAGHRSAPRDA